MKKLISVLLMLFAAYNAQSAKIVTDSIKSTILKTTQKYNIYLPNGFENSNKKYPVVYLLHGLSDDYNAWRERGRMDWALDELIGTGEAVPMIVLMPNAGGRDTHNTWNGYFNMPG